MGVEAAFGHLIGHGHERIAYVGADSFGDMEERRESFLGAISAAHGLRDGYLQLVPNTIAGGELALSLLMELVPRPTAILAASDVLALGMIHAAYERGIAIPGDLSIAGFDDIPQAAASVPGLTTVRMPINEIMAAALDLGVGPDQWDRHGVPPRHVFEPSLIVRRSTAPVGDRFD